MGLTMGDHYLSAQRWKWNLLKLHCVCQGEPLATERKLRRTMKDRASERYTSQDTSSLVSGERSQLI